MFGVRDIPFLSNPATPKSIPIVIISKCSYIVMKLTPHQALILRLDLHNNPTAETFKWIDPRPKKGDVRCKWDWFCNNIKTKFILPSIHVLYNFHNISNSFVLTVGAHYNYYYMRSRKGILYKSLSLSSEVLNKDI